MPEIAQTMADTNGRRSGVRFDPTINLGHICTAAAFLFSAGMAWQSTNARIEQVNARIEQNVRDIERVSKEGHSIEARLTVRLKEERTRLDQTVLRTADDIREIKSSVRDGFRDLDTKLERKADKPGR